MNFRDLWNRVSEKFASATERVRDAAPDAMETVKDFASDASESVQDRLDEFSGDTVYRAVMDGMAKQDEYNDILATKLQEALDRIGKLEAEVRELKSK